MKIVVVNGSPNGESGATQIVVDKLLPILDGAEVEEVYLRQGQNLEEILTKINRSNGFILVSPVYWNGLPFAMMQLLAKGQYRILRQMPFACILQSDSAGKSQFQLLFDMLHLFAKKANLHLLRLIGIEQGGALYAFGKNQSIKPPLSGLKREFGVLQECFVKGEAREDVCIDFHIPHLLYAQMEKKRWKAMVEENITKK